MTLLFTPARSRDRNQQFPTTLQANIYYLAAVYLGAQVAVVPLTYRIGGVALKQLLIFGLLPVLFLVGASRRSVWAVFRLRPISAGTAGKCLALALLNFILAQGLAILVISWLRQLGWRPVIPYTQLLADGPPTWLVFAAMAVVPALVEEWAFRGFLLTGHQQTLGSRAWIATGLLFGIIHMSVVRLPGLAALGWVFAYAAQRTGSLLPGIIMHLANNSLALGLAYRALGEIDPAELALGSSLPWPVVIVWAGAAAVALPAIIALLRSLPARTEELAHAPAGDPEPEVAGGSDIAPEHLNGPGGPPAGRRPPWWSWRSDWTPALIALVLIALAWAAEIRQMIQAAH